LPLVVVAPGGLDPDHTLLPLPETAHPQADPLAEIARRELRRVLDDELDRLPQKYRAPVMLCYLDGMTNEQAARELGWPAGSMSWRLERARDLLRRRLAGRGLSLTMLVFLLAAGLATVWKIGQTGWVQSRGVVPLRQTTGPLPSHKQTGPEIERLLALLERRDGISTLQHNAWLAAQAASSAAARLAESHPALSIHAAAWQQNTGAMQSAALLLAQASSESDSAAIRTAARRLSESCTQCHLALRP
jgi:RNA polymerase sigma-70 factor (ECF subfamily)